MEADLSHCRGEQCGRGRGAATAAAVAHWQLEDKCRDMRAEHGVASLPVIAAGIIAMVAAGVESGRWLPAAVCWGPIVGLIQL